MADLYTEHTKHMILDISCLTCEQYPNCGWSRIYNYRACEDFQRMTAQEINTKKGGNDMGYSKKAKAAEANAEESKKDLIQVGQVTVTRASELDMPDDQFKIMFDINVRGVAVQGLCFQSYTNKQGEKGDMITFPSYKAKNGKYYNHAWFPITKELKDDIIKQIDSLIG